MFFMTKLNINKEQKVVDFSKAKIAINHNISDTKYYKSPAWKQEYVNAEDIEFIKDLKLRIGDSSEASYVTINWEMLMPRLRYFTRLQNAISLETTSNTIMFNRDFKLGCYTFKQGQRLDKDTSSKLIETFQDMFSLSGKMNENVFMSRFIPTHKTNNKILFYENIKANGQYKKGIVEDFVKNYIDLEPERKQYEKLNVHNIVRMVKQSYYLTEQTKYANERSFKVSSQMYLLTGAQGTGKTELIKGLFDGYVATVNRVSPESPLYVKERASNLAVLIDEMSANNRRDAVGSMKADVSQTAYQLVEKYEKDSTYYLNSSVLVGATNDTNVITDTTSSGDNRRYRYIVFREKAGWVNNVNRIINFWRSKGCKKINDGNRYDTREYFLNMFYTIIFTDEYKDIPMELVQDSKEIYELNAAFGNSQQNMTELKSFIESLVNGYVATDKSVAFNKMKSGKRLLSFNNFQDVTESMLNGDSKENAVKGIRSYSDSDFIGASDPVFDDVIKVDELNYIAQSDLTKLLKNQHIKYNSQADVDDAMQLFGYKINKIYGKTRGYVKQ